MVYDTIFVAAWRPTEERPGNTCLRKKQAIPPRGSPKIKMIQGATGSFLMKNRCGAQATYAHVKPELYHPWVDGVSTEGFSTHQAMIVQEWNRAAKVLQLPSAFLWYWCETLLGGPPESSYMRKPWSHRRKINSCLHRQLLLWSQTCQAKKKKEKIY